jgi:hypothetical protein
VSYLSRSRREEPEVPARSEGDRPGESSAWPPAALAQAIEEIRAAGVWGLQHRRALPIEHPQLVADPTMTRLQDEAFERYERTLCDRNPMGGYLDLVFKESSWNPSSR